MSRPNNPVMQASVEELGNLFLSVTGGYVFYVGSDAQVAVIGDAAVGVKARCFSSVNAALASCVSGRGDVIYVLPGYTESIGAADAWSNLGTKTDITIIGMGRGTNRPTFTWTAADSTVLFDSANFRLLNCNLYLAGAHAAGAALTVAAPITVTANGCGIYSCDIFYGFDADQGVTIGITVTAGQWFEFKSNYCFCAQAAGATLTTSFLYLDGANYCRVWDNTIDGSTSSTTVGSVRFINNASVGIEFLRNRISNKKAVSVHAVTQMDGVLGWCDQNVYGILDNTTLAGWVAASAGNGPQHGHDVTVNLAAENAAAMTPVSA